MLNDDTTRPQPQGALLVGGGFIAGAHAEALRRLGIPLLGVVASTPEHTEDAARRFGLRPYPDSWTALHDPAVTVVHDCAPSDVHMDINLEALKAGKHVFSEKPLGVSVDECSRQVRAARLAACQTAVNFTYRGYAAVQTLRDIVQGGELGEVRYMTGHYLQDWLLFDTDFNWRVGAVAAETRAVSDIGSHLSDLARFVTGREPERLLARFSTLHPQRRRPLGVVQTFTAGNGETEAFDVTTEDQASLLVNYSGGIHANFELSQVAAGHKNDLQLEVFGTTGSVKWRQERPEELELGSRTYQRTVRLKDPVHPFTHYPGGHPEGYADAITNVIRRFYEGLSGNGFGSPSIATFEDGLAAACFTEGAYQSQLRGEWMSLDRTSVQTQEMQATEVTK